MPYFLDGNNLIGLVRHTARPSEEDRDALVAEIAGRLRQTRARATLYFDGPAGARPTALGSLSVRTASGSSADEAILREIRGSRAPSECIVVTADRGLARRAREAGAKVAAPADFFARFGRDAGAGEARTETGRVDLEDWMKWFGEESNRSE